MKDKARRILQTGEVEKKDLDDAGDDEKAGNQPGLRRSAQNAEGEITKAKAKPERRIGIKFRVAHAQVQHRAEKPKFAPFEKPAHFQVDEDEGEKMQADSRGR